MLTPKLSSILQRLAVSAFCSVLLLPAGIPVRAETLQSQTYKIEDASVNSGGTAMNSSTFSMLDTLGDYSADSRMTSASYELKSGFPNGMLANVPKIRCFETNTTSSNTNCTEFPHNNGTQSECGYGGCYYNAKIEITNEGNPFDTLYLVKVLDVTDNIEYYLKSDHTLGSGYDFSNFMTICALQGRDANDNNCYQSGTSGWNPVLQSTDIFALKVNTHYQASVLALSGDFTGTRYSDTVDATTTLPTLNFDIDIAPVSGGNTHNSAPYSIDLGTLPYQSPTTAINLIWFSMGTNSNSGMNVFIKDANNGLFSSSKSATIPSESEDLGTDPNSNGGYGLKTYHYTPSQTDMGPLQLGTVYDTGTVNTVGALSTTNTLLFFTNSLSTNLGPLVGGRGAVYIKGRAAFATPASGDYSDPLTAVIVVNY